MDTAARAARDSKPGFDWLPLTRHARVRCCRTWLVVCALVGCTRNTEHTQPEGHTAPAPPPTHDGRRLAHNTAETNSDALRVVLLGTGTPIPDSRRAGPALAVVAGSEAYLVDAGPGVVRRAAAASARGVTALTPTRLTRVFVTHLHSDHTLGLADLMLTPAVVGRREPLAVFGPPGIEAMVRHLESAYSVDMQMRRQVEGASAGYQFNATTVKPGLVYRDAHVVVHAFAVAHGAFKNAVGYRFASADRVVVVSGDTAPNDAVVAACDGCDVLVHEVYCARGLRSLPEAVQRYHRHFHTAGPELAALASRARPKLVILTHLLPFGCSEAELLAEVRTGYSGETVLGEDLNMY